VRYRKPLQLTPRFLAPARATPPLRKTLQISIALRLTQKQPQKERKSQSQILHGLYYRFRPEKSIEKVCSRIRASQKQSRFALLGAECRRCWKHTLRNHKHNFCMKNRKK
jgi:hypothetical protein